MRARGTIALVLLFAWGACASTAGAASLAMEFTEARANVGVQLDDAALFEAPDTAPLAAEIDAGGAISGGVLQVPQFSTSITDPIDADVTVDFDIGTITGSFDQGTGALTLSGTAGGTLTAHGGTYDGEACTVLIPEVLELSTAGSSGGDKPRSGVPFTAGLSGPGAIAGTWTHMDATPVDAGDPDNVSFCNNVEGRIGGEGGIWLDQEGVESTAPSSPSQPPANPAAGSPPPSLSVCVVPKLAGKSLARAKAALRAANCSVGSVRKPKGLKIKAAVVKSAKPGVGATPANGKVHLRLGPKPQKAGR
jgi:hypothetical protein